MNRQQIKNLLGVPSKKFNFGIVENGSVDLMIYGAIGFDVDTDELVTELKSTDASQINVYINSIGGFAFDGIAIYNALKNHPATIVTNVEGLAASAASIIAMAGDEVQIGKSAMMMIHNPMSIAIGESDDMRKEADSLDKLQLALAQAYASKSGRLAADFIPMMDAETWFSADEAKEAGLADTITDDETTPAVTEESLNVFNHVPDRLRAVARATKPQPLNGHSGKRTSRGVTAPAATKGGPVNLDDFKAFAAANPDAVAGYIEQGKNKGAEEATAAERTRVKAVIDASAGNHALACDAIAAGHNAAAVSLAARAAADAKAGADAALATANAEIQRLKDETAFNRGSQNPVNMRGEPQSPTSTSPTDAASIEAKAKDNWAKNVDGCRESFADEKTYTNVMKREAGVR